MPWRSDEHKLAWQKTDVSLQVAPLISILAVENVIGDGEQRVPLLRIADLPNNLQVLSEYQHFTCILLS